MQHVVLVAQINPGYILCLFPDVEGKRTSKIGTVGAFSVSMANVDYQSAKGNLAGLVPNLNTTLTVRQRRFHTPATKVVSSCFGVGESKGI